MLTTCYLDIHRLSKAPDSLQLALLLFLVSPRAVVTTPSTSQEAKQFVWCGSWALLTTIEGNAVVSLLWFANKTTKWVLKQGNANNNKHNNNKVSPPPHPKRPNSLIVLDCGHCRPWSKRMLLCLPTNQTKPNQTGINKVTNTTIKHDNHKEP